jgi:hypothetical protein
MMTALQRLLDYVKHDCISAKTLASAEPALHHPNRVTSERQAG